MWDYPHLKENTLYNAALRLEPMWIKMSAGFGFQSEIGNSYCRYRLIMGHYRQLFKKCNGTVVICSQGNATPQSRPTALPAAAITSVPFICGTATYRILAGLTYPCRSTDGQLCGRLKSCIVWDYTDWKWLHQLLCCLLCKSCRLATTFSHFGP